MADEVTKFVDIEESATPENGDGQESFDSTGFDEQVQDADMQAQIERGDFIDDEVPDAGGDEENDGVEADQEAEADVVEGGEVPDEGAGEDDTLSSENIDTLHDIAGDEDEEEPTQPAGIPFARAGQIAREKNAAADLTQAILDGAVDKRWVDDLGGTQAVIKGIASGQIKIEHQGDNAKPQEVEVPKELQSLYDQLDQLEEQHSDASIDADATELKRLSKEINKLNRKIITEESRVETARTVEAERQQAFANDAEKVAEVQAELIEKHVELQTDTNEYYGFIARRDAHLKKGAMMSEALLAAAHETFPNAGSSDDAASNVDKIRSERKAKAIGKNATVLNQQPPNGKRGAGQRGTPPIKDIGDMSDEEFAQLSEEDKAKARGDFL